MTLHLEFNKWLQTARVAWTNLLAYRFDFVLRMVAPAIVFLVIKYNLWLAIYATNGKELIGSYTLQAMLDYQVWVFFVNLLAQSYASHNMAVDIRMGKISTYLVYPFDFWQYHTASFLGFFALQFVVTAFGVLILSLGGFVEHFSVLNFSMGIAFTFVVAAFWFVSQFIIGVLGFWLEETWIFRVIFIMIAQILSGSIIPIELYPPWFKEFLFYTPFPYITFVPAKIFMGQFDQVLYSMGILGLWLVAGIGLCMVLWKQGLKLYSGAGM